MNLELLVNYLRDQGLGTPGVDLFYNHMPSQIQDGVLLTIQMPVLRNPYVRALHKGAFQTIARGLEGSVITERLERIADALDTSGLRLGQVHFRYILARHSPLVFPRAESDLAEASVNFDFAYTLSL